MISAETILAFALAGVIGFVPTAWWDRWSPLHGLAALVLLQPVMEDLIGFLKVAPLITQPTTLKPYTVQQLIELPWRIARSTLAVPLIGLGVVAILGGRRVVQEHLAPLVRGWRGWGPELAMGWGAIPIIVASEAIALALLAGPASFLNTGNESALFANAGIEHVLLLSLVPAIVEEVYYRGFVQGVLESLIPGEHRVWLAIGVQGLLFGLAHGGFTNLAHVLGPLVFGVAMGYARSTVGLGVCVVSHAAVNLFYFSVDPGAGSFGLQAAVGILVVTGFVALWVMRETVWARVRAGPYPVMGAP